MAKKKTYIILALIILAVFGYFYFKNKKPQIVYTTETVFRGNLARTVSVTGNVISPVEADLSFKLSGRITKMFVDIGDTVKTGDKIATIEAGTLNDQLAQAEAEVAFEKRTLSSMERNHTSSYFAKQAQREVIDKAQSAEDEILTELKETTIYAPMDGIVIRKNAEVGETILANSAASAAPIVTIANGGPLELEAKVPESDVTKVSLDQMADFTLDAFAVDDIFHAKVSEIEPASTVIQDVVYYKVKLQFDETNGQFKNGMSANIDIKTAEKDNVVSIPTRAVKTEGSQKFVDILNADGKTTTRINIETGLSGDDGMVEVTSGLKGGEKVVTLTK
jgi:RND family efflux transporter MFP subunit